MKAATLTMLASLSPDGGKALAEHKAQQAAEEEAQQAAAEEAEEQATTAALASVDWDAIHGDALRKYDIESARYAADWQTAKLKGDCRHAMGKRPMRPDWIATPDLKVNENYAPLASAPRASAWEGPEPRRWIIGEGRDWTNKDGGTSARVVISESKGARDERTNDSSPCLIAYAPRSYEGAEGPHRAPTLEQQQEAQRLDWQAELERVNEGRSKP